ncbi:MAG: hypothetical protein AAFZ65_09310 [Planctomycetota bacterium]
MDAQSRARTLTSSLVVAVAIAGVALPGTAGSGDLLVVLGLTALAALPLGIWAGAAGVGAKGLSIALAAWPVAAATCVALGPQRQLEPSIATAVAGACAPMGLALLGSSVGRRWRPHAPLLAHAAALAALLSVGAAVGGGLYAPRLAERHPDRAAALLDGSLLTVSAEAAGVDWMRHPVIYGPAGTDWFSDRRRPYTTLAGAGLLVVGFTAAAIAGRGSRGASANRPAAPGGDA